MTDLSNHIGEADEKVTADHAERLERAEKWVAEMGKWKTLNPTTAEAYIYGSFLLSEIAALRGERDEAAELLKQFHTRIMMERRCNSLGTNVAEPIMEKTRAFLANQGADQCS